MRAAVGQEQLPEAAPETCGLDGDKLEAMRKVLTPWGIKSVLVVKNGRKAWEWHEADLAKFGLLYARKGVWEGRRIVSADWVAQSTVASTKGLLHYKPPIYGCYGYHWWVSAEQPEEVPDYFFAFGFGGQYLAVAPEEELVAVIRKGLAGRNKAILSRRLLHEYIFAALIGSRRTIPASQSSNEESSPASQAKDVTVRDGKAVRIVQQSVPRA